MKLPLTQRLDRMSIHAAVKACRNQAKRSLTGRLLRQSGKGEVNWRGEVRPSAGVVVKYRWREGHQVHMKNIDIINDIYARKLTKGYGEYGIWDFLVLAKTPVG